MKTKKALAILIIAFLAGILISTGIYYLIILDSIQRYEMEVKVSKNAGFNVATDKIYFSKVPPGSTGKRTLQIAGNKYRDIKVTFDVKGPIKPWIRLEDNNFVIPKGTLKNLTIQIMVPDNATIGTNLTGVLEGTFVKYW